jgi:hypothetical protein
MTTRIALLLGTVVLFTVTATVRAQEKSVITVKGSELNNGVVIVEVVKDGKALELQCNQGIPTCTQLKSGKYQMVELPHNSGMYDCRDVQVFAESSASFDAEKKIGEYCLSEK